MGARRFVTLDPDGTAGSTWLFVIVGAETGVVYQQQYGGTACRQGQLEGFLVPVVGTASLPRLREMFERHFGGVGAWDHAWSDDERDSLRAIVGEIIYWMSDGTTDEPSQLRLDDDRIRETDEAWIPVSTPDGPGVLVWSNSD
jgi:hypothetical protein